MILIGLTLFIQGLEIGLFPIGDTLALGFAQRGNVLLLLAFAFCLGFGTTAAEPALAAVAGEAARAAADAGTLAARSDRGGGLCVVVAVDGGDCCRDRPGDRSAAYSQRVAPSST